MEQPMATATATATSSRRQMRAEPYPTYVRADWARDHPDKYGAKAVTGFETILNIIKAEISGEQTWGLTVDENAPGYVKGVTKTLNWIGSTCGRAVDGACMATDAAFNFASFLIDANNKDKELIQAMMDLLGTATTVITAPVKATLAVVLVNLYSGMLIKFGYAAPQAAASPSRSNDNSKQGPTDEEEYKQQGIDATSLPNDIEKDNDLVVGDYVAKNDDYLDKVAAQNER
jgi:hypothetical protein